MKIKMRTEEINLEAELTELELVTLGKYLPDLFDFKEEEEPDDGPEEMLPIRIFESVVHENKIKRATDWLNNNRICYTVENSPTGRPVINTHLTPTNMVALRKEIYEDGCDRTVII